MTTVSCQAPRSFIRTLNRAKIDPARLVDGLPISLTDLHNPSYRLPVDLYYQLCERFAQLLENPVSPLPPNPLERFLNLNSALLRLLEIAPISVMITDLQGLVTFINTSSKKADLFIEKGDSFFSILHQNGHYYPAERITEIVNQHQLLQVAWSRPNDLWFDSYGIPVYVSGEAAGFLFVNLNITDRKKAEKQLEKRLLQMRTLAEVMAEVKAVMDLPQLIPFICQLVKENFGLYHAHIYLLDEEGKTLIMEGGSGEIGRLIAASKRSFSMAEDTRSIVVRAAKTRTYYISNDIRQDPYFVFNPFLPDTRSEMAVPIMVGDYLIGILDLQSDQPNFFLEEDIELEQILADQLAVALQNAELYENILQQWEITNAFRDIGMALDSSQDLTAILRRILVELQRILPYQTGSIWLKDAQGKLNIKAAHGLEQFDITEAKLQELADNHHLPTREQIDQIRHSLIIPETHQHPSWVILPGLEWVHSWVASPIYSRDTIIGHINLEHSQSNFFQKQHEYILDTVVRQIALVVENHMLFESERSLREIAETLSDIGLVLTSQLDTNTVLQLILAQVGRLLPYEAAAIWLENGEGKFKPALHVGYRRFGVEDRLNTLGFSANELFLNDTPIISDTHKDASWQIEPGFEWVRSWAAAPVLRNGKMVGQLVLDHTQPNFYKDAHRPLLTNLANYISIAINNAHLFEAERRRRQEIELLQRGNISLTASLELPVVLDAILNAVIELAEVDATSVFLYENNEMRFMAGILNGKRLVSSPFPPVRGGLIYMVAESGHQLLVENLAEHPMTKQAPNPWLTQFESMISMPLKFGERVVGVMNLYFKTRIDMQRLEMTAMQLLASQASIAIENARLYQAVQDYAALLESRVAERTSELERQRAQLHAIMDGMGEGVVYYEGTAIKYVNKVFRQMMGYSEADLDANPNIGQVLFGSPANYDLWQQKAGKQLDQRGSWQGELFLTRKDHSQLIAHVHVAAVDYSDGAGSGIATILRDISQEKRLQEQKDRFISNASHELRTPITNIQTRLYLIQKRPENITDHLKVIEEVTHHMADLVKDLLDLTRFEQGVIPMNYSEVGLQALLQQVIRVQSAEAQQKEIELTLDAPAQPITIQLDQSRIMQVLINLVANAISYTDPHGKVALVLLPPQDGMVVMAVADTGVGIAPELLPQVFQPFFRVQEGRGIGAGLGLSIAKEIVEAHGGHLEVTSELHQGSVFSIHLPIQAPK